MQWIPFDNVFSDFLPSTASPSQHLNSFSIHRSLSTVQLDDYSVCLSIWPATFCDCATLFEQAGNSTSYGQTCPSTRLCVNWNPMGVGVGNVGEIRLTFILFNGIIREIEAEKRSTSSRPCQSNSPWLNRASEGVGLLGDIDGTRAWSIRDGQSNTLLYNIYSRYRHLFLGPDYWTCYVPCSFIMTISLVMDIPTTLINVMEPWAFMHRHTSPYTALCCIDTR